MDESLEPEWQYFRDVLDEEEKENLISEASIAQEREVRYAKHLIEPELLREFLYIRDPDGSDEEWEKQRGARSLMEQYGRAMEAAGGDDLSRKIRRRELPGIDDELVQIADGTMKDTYRGLEEDTIVQIPSPQLMDTPKDAVEQALTWANNQEVLAENNVPVATDYDIVISEHRGHLTPATVGDFRPGLIEYRDVTDEMKENFRDRHGAQLEELFRKRGIRLANLLMEGEVIYNEQPRDIVNAPFNGLGYDTGTEDVVVYDMGEASESTFELIPHMDVDSYDEFMDKHGIRSQAENILSSVDEEYTEKTR